MDQTPAVRDRYQVDQFNQAIGAEMIAKKWGLSREALDEFSARSHAGPGCAPPVDRTGP